MIKLSVWERFLKIYLYAPIKIDSIIITIALIVEHFVKNAMVNRHMRLLFILDTLTDKDYFSSIISTLVALAGFMIAALTIMVTVKASLKARGYSDSNTALDYLFTTKIYFDTLKVFKHTIAEFIILLVITYTAWLAVSNENQVLVFKILCCVSFATATAIIRSLYIFFRVMNLDNLKKEQTIKESNEDKQTRLLEEILKKLSEK